MKIRLVPDMMVRTKQVGFHNKDPGDEIGKEIIIHDPQFTEVWFNSSDYKLISIIRVSSPPWYSHARCSSRLGAIQANRLSFKSLIAGEGVPLMRTASWHFIAFIFFSRLFYLPEAWRGVQDTFFSKVSISNVTGASDLHAKISFLCSALIGTSSDWMESYKSVDTNCESERRKRTKVPSKRDQRS